MAEEQDQTQDETESQTYSTLGSGTSGAGKASLFMGRRRIYSKNESVSASNVVDMVIQSATTHAVNVGQMKYLWRYYRGKQPILGRVKEVRPEINNTIVENHAQEVVAFKTGYQLSEPIQYICRPSDDDSEDDYARQISVLNGLMFAEDMDSKNRDLFEWMCIAGVGYKFIEPDKEDREHMGDEPYDIGGAPFNVYIPEPWDAFVVYSARYHHRPIAGVWVSRDEYENPIYNVYTSKKKFIVKDGKMVSEQPNTMGFIPIIEYDLSNARMGVFEAALPVLDAINKLESNRMDGIEQVVQALYLFKNCEIDQDTFLDMLELGAVSVSSNEGVQGDVSLITNNLEQQHTQTMKDDLYQALIDICGMPNRNQCGANDTGSAVLLRDGWTLAESHAKTYELQFKKAERQFLSVVLSICAQSNEPVNLRLRDIDLAFNRRNYDNVLTKAQVLTTMLATDKVDPLDCFKACGLFTDPSAAYLRSVAYIEERERKAAEALAAQQAQQAQQPTTNANGIGQESRQSDHDGDGVVGEDNHGRADG